MRFTLSVIFSAVILAVLVSLGLWQVRRLAWKEAYLADLEARISAAPVALPARPDPVRDQYLPVKVSGTLTGEGLQVLASTRDAGAGYRIIQVLVTGDGRRVMVDLGFEPIESHESPRLTGPIRVTGNLHWPDEVDSWTPAPEPDKGLFFARDVPVLADALGAEPLLIVARTTEPPVEGVLPLPVSTEAIPNRHLEYVFTWFAFAFIWSVISFVMLRRIWLKRVRPQKGN